jgi:fatty acid desaturase
MRASRQDNGMARTMEWEGTIRVSIGGTLDGGDARTPPAPAAVAHLRPRAGFAAAHTLGSAVAAAGGVLLAAQPGWLAYLAGQAILAAAFVHAFVLLHEAGHYTLFRSRRLNRLVGHLAGFVALIPFHAWQRIHARHHRYTGWQDLDATTASLVPRAVAPWERAVIDFAWRAWVPLFSVLYRLQNYWNLRRIAPFLRDEAARRAVRLNVFALLAAYAALAAAVGPLRLLVLAGPALLLSLVIEDVLLLSQHTHVPQRLSGGVAVRPFPPLEQAQFTRTLRLPCALSLALMHFDAHELHHMYPNVPGYLLARIPYRAPNEVDWIAWTRAAKRLSGIDFLFRNRDDTGAQV